jgi:hypothetical protein
VILEVDPRAGRLIRDQQEIPGFMTPMVMSSQVRPASLLHSISPGALVGGHDRRRTARDRHHHAGQRLGPQVKRYATGLAPDIVDAILHGWHPKVLRLAEILGNGPLVWEEQRSA